MALLEAAIRCDLVKFELNLKKLLRRVYPAKDTPACHSLSLPVHVSSGEAHKKLHGINMISSTGINFFTMGKSNCSCV